MDVYGYAEAPTNSERILNDPSVILAKWPLCVRFDGACSVG